MAKYKKKLDDDIRCPLEYGLAIFGGKWKSRIICVLSATEKLRYSELRREMCNITDAVLAATLKDLIEDGIVERKSYDEIPPRVEYMLTQKGTSDIDLITYTNKSMRVYLAMLFIYGVQVACQYSFVALDQAPKAIFLTIWRKIIILIPLIFILPHFMSHTVMAVYLAEPIADTIAVCTTAPMFYFYYCKLKG